MKNKKNTSKYFLVVSVVGLIIMISAYYFAMHEINKKVEEIRIVLSNINAIEFKKAREGEMMEENKTITEARVFLENIVVPKEDLVSYIEYIEGIGPLSGAVVELLSIKEEEKVEARVQSSGSWTEVMRSVKLIENIPYRIEIVDLKIDRISSDAFLGGQASFRGNGEKNNVKDINWRAVIEFNALII